MKKNSSVTSSEVQQWFEEESDERSSLSEPGLDPSEKYARSQLRVVRETKDYQLDYLRHALEPSKELIDTSPPYQRRLRWNRKKRSLLIESFLLNIPVPPIFLFEHDYNAYEVIDGRQRLETIREFLSNGFALTGLEFWTELERMRFLDLPSVLQKGLLRRSLTAVVLLAETRGLATDDLDVRRLLFDRLNTGGVGLNPQELRNALYPGPFNALLINLARTEPFTAIWGIPRYKDGEEQQPSDSLVKNPLFSTLADAELVLRFFALMDAVENFRHGSLRRILDRYMKEMMTAKPEALESLAILFKSSISKLYAIFGDATFRLPKTGRPSRPLYDALMVAINLVPGPVTAAEVEAVRTDLARALSDKQTYDILVGRGNTIEAIRSRVDLASSILSQGT